MAIIRVSNIAILFDCQSQLVAHAFHYLGYYLLDVDDDELDHVKYNKRVRNST